MTSTVKKSGKIITKRVGIETIQLNASGEADIRSYLPTSEGTFLACMIEHQSSVVPRGALQVFSDGKWISGPVNAVVTNLTLKYLYQL